MASGARFTGASIQFIDEAYDTGPILAQRCVAVLPTDTPEQVAARVLAEVRAFMKPPGLAGVFLLSGSLVPNAHRRHACSSWCGACVCCKQWALTGP